MGINNFHFGFARPEPMTNGETVVVAASRDVQERGFAGVADDWATGFQFDLGAIAAGAEAWAGFVVGHQGNPFAAAETQAWLDAYVAGRGPKQLLDDERAAWAAFQTGVKVPAGLRRGSKRP